MNSTKHVVVIGAGPAGLSAAYLLAKRNIATTVIEADEKYVGGISRTVSYKSFGFDIGGHRFFSKSPEVNALWNEILGNEFIERPRKSRIYFGSKFYPYPLDLLTTLKNLGIFRSAACVLSYVKIRIFPRKNVKNFEDWVVNHFGEMLFSIFFKTYTEKVWGMKCTEISSDWAAQRIKGLSLSKAIWHSLKPQGQSKNGKDIVKTLINSFKYPKFGPGQMWEKAAEKTTELGGKIVMGAKVVSIKKPASEILVTYEKNGQIYDIVASDVISSMPLRDAALSLEPKISEAAVAAANALKYRDFLVVALIVKDKNIFDDNWIYIHEPNVKVGRIQNFKSWSPHLVPDASLNCYGMEYFCFEGDGLWNSLDEKLIELAKTELVSLKLANADDVIDGVVVRQPKAYPVYDDSYENNVNIIREELAQKFPTFHPIGRAGMHKYNNQDHAMMTAMLTVENIVAGISKFNVWQVNQDAEYHEESSEKAASGERLVPGKSSF